MEWRNVKWCIDHDSVTPPTPSKWIPQKHHVKSPSSFCMVHSHWWVTIFVTTEIISPLQQANIQLLKKEWTLNCYEPHGFLFFYSEYFITHVLIKSKKASHPHHSPWSWISWELLYVMWASEQRDIILENIMKFKTTLIKVFMYALTFWLSSKCYLEN